MRKYLLCCTGTLNTFRACLYPPQFVAFLKALHTTVFSCDINYALTVLNFSNPRPQTAYLSFRIYHCQEAYRNTSFLGLL